jgi:hypothetical protein
MFNVSDSGVLTLKDNVDRNSIKRVVIPNILNGLSVTTIGDYAFSDCTSLASVDLGSVAPSMVRPSLIAHLSHLLI